MSIFIEIESHASISNSDESMSSTNEINDDEDEDDEASSNASSLFLEQNDGDISMLSEASSTSNHTPPTTFVEDGGDREDDVLVNDGIDEAHVREDPDGEIFLEDDIEDREIDDGNCQQRREKYEKENKVSKSKHLYMYHLPNTHLYGYCLTINRVGR